MRTRFIEMLTVRDGFARDAGKVTGAIVYDYATGYLTFVWSGGFYTLNQQHLDYHRSQNLTAE